MNASLNKLPHTQSHRLSHTLSKLCLSVIATGLLSLSLTAQAMTDLQGKPVELLEYVGKGKWTIFEIWASDCPYCPDAILYMRDFKHRYPQADLYGISLDGDNGYTRGRQAAQRFIQKHRVNFPTLMSDTVELDKFLLDQGEEALIGTPALIIYNPKGELVGVESGAIIAQDVIDFIQNKQSD